MLAPLWELVGPNPALRRIGVAWFLVNLAEWTFVTALSIHEYSVHGALALGLIGARFAPGALLGLTVLRVATRPHPLTVLRFLSVLRCVAAAGAAVALGTGAGLPVLVAIVWGEAVIAAPYRPVQSSALPALAGTPRELSVPAGSIPIAKALAWAAGALTGSLGLSVARPETIVLVAAGTFLLAALLVGRWRAASITPVLAAGELRAGQPRLYTIAAGFELVATRARALLTLGGARSLTRGLWTSLAVVSSLRLLDLGSSGVGLLMAAAGAGAAVAVPLSLRFAGKPRLGRQTALAFALSGLPITLVGAIAQTVPAVALIVVWGAAAALADSLSNSLIHRVVEARSLATSVAAVESAKLLLEGLGALLAPALLAVVGIRTALLLAGIPLLLVVLVSLRGLNAIDQLAETRIRPLRVLRRTPSLGAMTMLSLESLAGRLQRIQVGAHTELVRQGEQGDRFYLIDHGRVEVSIDGYPVAVLGPGASFGEKALLRPVTRSATVTTLEPADLWYLDAADYVAGVTGDAGPVAAPSRRRSAGSLEEIVGAIPLFGAVGGRALSACGSVCTATAGETIVHQGDPGDCFYVLLDGEAEVRVGSELMRTLAPGDWFGEIALLHQVPRTASVIAREACRLWVLERPTFLRLLGRATPATAAGSAVPPESQADRAVGGAGLVV